MRGRFEGNDYLPRRLCLQILLADGGAKSAVSGVKSVVYGGPAIVYNVSYMKPFPFGAILGEFEQLVLLALLRLGNGAFGAAIHREIVGRRRKHYLLDTAGQRALARAYRTFGMMTAGLQDELEELTRRMWPGAAARPPKSSVGW